MRVDRRASFLKFVYPVVFNPVHAGSLLAGARALRWSDVRVWTEEQFPDEDLVRHVADYLNAGQGQTPEAHGSVPGAGPPTPSGRWMGTAQLYAMHEEALKSPLGLGASARWGLRLADREIPFSFQRIELALFRAGVAFLTLDVRPWGENLDDWLDFAYFFRFARGRRAVRVGARQSVGFDTTKNAPVVEGYAPRVLAPDWDPDEGGSLNDIVSGLLRQTAQGVGNDWPQEVFIPGQLLPFGVYYLDGADPAAIPRLLEQVRRPMHSRQVVEYSGDLVSTSSKVLEYAEHQWFTFSLDGGAFIAFDAPENDFFRSTLPDHLAKQYFLLFLIALHQRFGLMRLSAAVCRAHELHANDPETRASEFERIRDQLLDFTARGLFSQAMQRQNHHDVYVCWQDTFQLDRLYAEVRDEVRDLAERAQYDLTQAQKRIAEEDQRASDARARVIEQLGLAVGFPALLLGFLGINIDEVTNGGGISIWSAIGLVGAALIVGLVVAQLLQVWRRSALSRRHERGSAELR